MKIMCLSGATCLPVGAGNEANLIVFDLTRDLPHSRHTNHYTTNVVVHVSIIFHFTCDLYLTLILFFDFYPWRQTIQFSHFPFSLSFETKITR
jgi:hypothetical protein